MTATRYDLQDAFLNVLRSQQIAATFRLTNGYKIHGLIKSFDAFTIELEADGKQQLLYKHALSSVVPEKNITIPKGRAV